MILTWKYPGMQLSWSEYNNRNKRDRWPNNKKKVLHLPILSASRACSIHAPPQCNIMTTDSANIKKMKWMPHIIQHRTEPPCKVSWQQNEIWVPLSKRLCRACQLQICSTRKWLKSSPATSRSHLSVGPRPTVEREWHMPEERQPRRLEERQPSGASDGV
jgi:hypothetical protein